MDSVTAPVSPGSSGSPVLDKDGYVLGVATLNSTGRFQNLNFARSARDLTKLISGISADAKPKAFATLDTTKKDLLADSDYIEAKTKCDHKDFSHALKALNQLKERFPPNEAPLLILFGKTYAGLSLHEEALNAFRSYVKIEPTDSDGWLGLSAEFRHFRAFDEAAEAAKQAVDVAPDDVRSWRELGEVFFDQNNFQFAVEPLRKATSLDKEDWEAWYYLNAALRNSGKIAEADAALSRANILAKWRTPPDANGAKPVSRSRDGSIIRFDDGVLLFMNDKHIEWEAGGFIWRAYDGHWGFMEVEKVGPSKPAEPPDAPDKAAKKTEPNSRN